VGDAVWEYLKRQPGFLEELASAQASLAEGGGVSWEEYKRQHRDRSERAGKPVSGGGTS
jgi:hypothetical protein